MTIIVTVRVNDGIVLAADSATSFIDANGHVAKIYNSANKIFNLVKVWPIGAMTYGAGSIGSASISTLSKDLRRRLTPALVAPGDQLALNEGAYTIQQVAERARDFLDQHYRAAYPVPIPEFYLGYRICGYSAGGTLPEAWEIRIRGADWEGPERLYEDDRFGPRWAGETEAIDRLVLGIGSKFYEVLEAQGLDQAAIAQAIGTVIKHLSANLFLPAMPIQDAIDLAHFLVDSSVKFAHFSLRPATVGGPIEIATITKHEGFKWVSRKHYYSREFNVEG